MIGRRGVLTGLLGLVAAPAIARSGVLMPINSRLVPVDLQISIEIIRPQGWQTIFDEMIKTYSSIVDYEIRPLTHEWEFCCTLTDSAWLSMEYQITLYEMLNPLVATGSDLDRLCGGPRLQGITDAELRSDLVATLPQKNISVRLK